jgi:hypothetical protein
MLSSTKGQESVGVSDLRRDSIPAPPKSGVILAFTVPQYLHWQWSSELLVEFKTTECCWHIYILMQNFQCYSPLLAGDSIWRWVLAPPALSPNIVTLFGFPPNAAILSRTQRSAATWSFSPLLPGHTASSVLRKPETFECHYTCKVRYVVVQVIRNVCKMAISEVSFTLM